LPGLLVRCGFEGLDERLASREVTVERPSCGLRRGCDPPCWRLLVRPARVPLRGGFGVSCLASAWSSTYLLHQRDSVDMLLTTVIQSDRRRGGRCGTGQRISRMRQGPHGSSLLEWI
jgi:hypothetical protein